MVMRQCELIKESKLLKIKSKILSNLFSEKYGLNLEEFNNTAGTERVNIIIMVTIIIIMKQYVCL